MFPPHTVTMTMDASMIGWGGHAQGLELHSALFHGLCDQEETSLHINVLELRVVHLMLCSLGETLLGQVIQIEHDNTMTVTYINKEQGICSLALNCEALRLYEWVVPRNIQLQAVHRPGVDNILADYLFHHVAETTEWSLDGKLVRRLFEMWGRPQIDLFASASNTHLPLWYSRAYHPEAIASNALLQQWTGLSLYAFPPFPLLARTLAKIRADEVEEVIVIAPTWPRRSWYTLLLQMACEIPCLLPINMDLLSQSLQEKGTLFHSDLKTFRLAAWKLSDRPSRVLDFQPKLLAQHSHPPGLHQGEFMMLGGDPMLAGVMNGVLIPFRRL